MNRGHDRDAEVDQAALVAHAETAVLRDAPLGDIELAHDLDARNDRRVPVLRDRRHGVVQHAVDAVLDGDFLVARLDVNITGAAFQRAEDRRVDQLDDRRDIAVGGGQLVDRERLVRVLLSPTTSSAKPSVTSSRTRCDCSVFFSRSEICVSVATLTRSFFFSSDRQLVDQVQIARIGQRDLERSVLRVQRNEVVAEHQVDRDRMEQIVIDLAFPQIDVLAAIARRKRLRLLRFLIRRRALFVRPPFD